MLSKIEEEKEEENESLQEKKNADSKNSTMTRTSALEAVNTSNY